MNKLKFAQFEADLYSITKEIYSSFKAKKGHESIGGFALYSDASASSISAALNTGEHLDGLSAESPEDKIYYK